MNIYMTPHALWHLQWIAQRRTDCEVSSMVVLSIGKKRPVVAEVALVNQKVSAAHVNLGFKTINDQ